MSQVKKSLQEGRVNERKAAGPLKESEEVLETIFANTQFLIAYMDRDFNFIRVNDAYARSVGRSSDYFVGKNHFDLFPHEENQSIFRKVRKTGEPYVAYEKAFEYADRPDKGTTYWDWTLHPIKRDSEEVNALLLVLQDVTNRVEAEKELREQDRRLRLLAQTVDEVFWLGTPGISKIHYVSPAYERIWGRTLESLYQSPGSFMEAIHPEDLERVRIEMKKGQENRMEMEYRIVRPDGEVRWIRDERHPICDDQGRVTNICGTVSDITRRKEMEAKLQDSMLRLEQSNRELRDFAYVTSHDLQEPLRKIQAFGNMLSSKYKDLLDEKGLDYLDRMIKAATRMRQLIEALLGYSRISSRPQSFTQVDLNGALREALSNLEARIKATGARIQADRLPTIAADHHQMVQLIQNIVANGLKYKKEGVPSVIRISHRVGRSAGGPGQKRTPFRKTCEIRIRDNGIGFEQKYTDAIFKPFQRLHGRSEYEGTGMGLAICRRIVERHGGSVGAESLPGQGAEFIVVLPFKQVEL